MDDRIDPRRMGTAIRRRWWLLLLLAILALLGASRLTDEILVVYRSRVSVLVGEALVSAQVGKDDLKASEDVARILASVLRERPVLQGVIEELHLKTTWTGLRDRIRASVTGGNRHLIEVTVEARSREEAIAIANQVPIQLQLLISDDKTSSAASHVRAFAWARTRAAERHILSAESVLSRLRRAARAESSPAVLEGLSDEIRDTQTVEMRWQQAHTTMYRFLSKFGSPSHLEVLEPAQAHPRGLASHAVLVTGLSEASALLIGLMAIYGLEARRPPWRALASPDQPRRPSPSIEVGAPGWAPRSTSSESSKLESAGDTGREGRDRAGSAEAGGERRRRERDREGSAEEPAAVPPVISIGGASRSGSTLLTLLLGRPEGFLAVGELRYVWSRGYQQNMLCGCGTPFRECDFWRSVLARAYGSFERTPAIQLDALQTAIGKIWHLPLLLTPAHTPEFDRRVERYVSHLARLCEALREVSGARSIVDSSKLPSYCYLLDRANGHQGMLIHLVRDSRAVAFSFQRTKRKPDIHWKEAYMKRFSPVKSAVDWNGLNLGMEMIRATHPRTSYVRYEDLVRDPAGEITRVNAGSELRDVLDLALPGEVNLEVAHTVSGNPLRFATGHLSIRADLAWESEMKRRDRQLVTGLTLPLLARYGYLSQGTA